MTHHLHGNTVYTGYKLLHPVFLSDVSCELQDASFLSCASEPTPASPGYKAKCAASTTPADPIRNLISHTSYGLDHLKSPNRHVVTRYRRSPTPSRRRILVATLFLLFSSPTVRHTALPARRSMILLRSTTALRETRDFKDLPLDPHPSPR